MFGVRSLLVVEKVLFMRNDRPPCCFDDQWNNHSSSICRSVCRSFVNRCDKCLDEWGDSFKNEVLMCDV